MATAFTAADDGTIPGAATPAEGRAVLREWAAVNIDRYVDVLQQNGWTFPSAAVPLPIPAARALLAHTANKVLDGAQRAALAAVQDAVQGAMDQLRATARAKEHSETGAATAAVRGLLLPTAVSRDFRGFFVRLSTRSPKDASDKRGARTQACVDAAVRLHLGADARLDRATLDALDLNTRLRIIRRALFDAMCVQDAEEAFDVLTRSSRIVSDLKRYLTAFGGRRDDEGAAAAVAAAAAAAEEAEEDCASSIDEDGEWDLQVMVREFVSIPLEGELRGFVSNGRLTAVTQYYSGCFFPELVEQRDAVLRRLAQFFDHIKGTIFREIGVRSFILDFAIPIDDAAPGAACWVVELNPWGERTGAGLFSWTDDAALLAGSADDGPETTDPETVEFRVRSEPLPDAHLRAMLMSWQHLLDGAASPAAADAAPERQDRGKDKCVVS